MKMTTAFDAVYWGSYRDFRRVFDGDVYALFYGNLSLLQMCVAYNSNLNDRVKIIKFLLEKGVDVNHLDRDGRNVLHNFFFFKANRNTDINYVLEVVECLLQADVNVNFQDFYGNTALSYVINLFDIDVEKKQPLYELLLNSGCDYSLCNEMGMSCLDYAKEKNDFIFIETVEKITGKDFTNHHFNVPSKVNLTYKGEVLNISDYGGFIVSNNVLLGAPVGYVFREKSHIKDLNGWNIYSINDDDEYVSNPDNFTMASIHTVARIIPVILEIFDAPYGTDLAFMYEQGVHVGFWDLNTDKETTIKEILGE